VTEVLPWDHTYWSGKLQAELYDFDSEALRSCFPVDAVLNGLFSITSTIYGNFHPRKTDVLRWRIKKRWN
jgi:Zn-dependent oligopeptidase